MSRVFVCGMGAVSPAGWSVPSMREALRQGIPLPVDPLPRPGWSKLLRSRPVPAPAGRPPFLSHPRLRRASPITHYAASATLEALAPLQSMAGNDCRLGVISCLNAGCVQYTCRFWAEALQDPITASPLLFPETVFSAPASHISALLGNTPSVYTLMGDPGTFLQGLSLAIDWLEHKQVEACVIVGSEEPNWLLADALWHLEHSAILSGGAGALCLSLNPAWSIGGELTAITSAHTMTPHIDRQTTAQAMRRELPACRPGDLLCDGSSDSHRSSAAELAAWGDWTAQRLSPKRILGEGLMAAAAWQCVAGVDALTQGQCTGVNVSLAGGSQQAIGARFERVQSANISTEPVL